MNVNYIARKQFKADGKTYMPGDIWEPTGSKFDDAVIRRFVTVQEVTSEPKPTRRKRDTGSK